MKQLLKNKNKFNKKLRWIQINMKMALKMFEELISLYAAINLKYFRIFCMGWNNQ